MTVALVALFTSSMTRVKVALASAAFVEASVAL
jgi:hypothetical protein